MPRDTGYSHPLYNSAEEERAIREADQAKFRREFDQYWSKDNDVLGLILKCHLIVEAFMTECLRVAFPGMDNFEDARLSFSQKHHLLTGWTFGFPWNAENAYNRWRACRLLQLYNSILDRNKWGDKIGHMKLRHYIVIGLSGVITSLSCGSRVEAAPTFQVVATFDYPGQPQGAQFGTIPMSINDEGVVAGQILMSDFSRHGFLRQANGTFSELINEPNDHADYYTVLTGVNAGSIVSGYYQKDDGFVSSFFLNNGVYSEFGIDGAISTYVLGLNNAGSFCGNSQGPQSAGFIDVAGVLTSFQVPDPNVQGTTATGLNNRNQCVGYYSDIFEHSYSYLRRANGSFVYPIGVLGDGTTFLRGINDRGFMVGVYQVGTAVHGVLILPNRQAVIYDYPGATGTQFFGINERGIICGWYADSAGVHGLIVRAKAGAD